MISLSEINCNTYMDKISPQHNLGGFIFKLKTNLKPLAKLIKNKKIRGFFMYINGVFSTHFYKKTILEYYGKLDFNKLDLEKRVVIEFLKHNPVNLFPYEFTKKYKPSDIKVFTDEARQLKYCFLDNKKIYFKRSCSEKKVQELCSALIMVQDPESPHRYLTNDFNVSQDDIVADIGAAEGDFALSIIEKVKKVYLFESDPELMEALGATFEPWKDRVVIVDKYVSNNTDGNCTTLDSYFRDNEKPNFLKIDIEGAEHDLIEGGESFLSCNNDIKIIMASYHRHNDETILSEKLQKHGFKTEFSKGYMLSIWDDIVKEPYLRRGLIRAIKKHV